MKKLFFILFLVIPAFCFAESLKTNSDANVRNSPSKEGAVITVLTKGTQIEGEKASTNNDWYEITVDGKTGYVHKSLMDTVVSINDLKESIIPFKSGLFWWIVIDKLILIGVFLYFFLTGKIGKAFLWALVCLASTLLITFILTMLTEELFITMFGFTSLLCVGVSPFILIILIVLLMIIWAMGTKSEPKLKAVTYWIEE